MNIVIEGLDNSGKSTLARVLATQLNRQVFSSEGPEKEPGELVNRVQRYAEHQGVIFDRHPCISDPIYSKARGKPCVLPQDVIEQFYASENLFIYCDAGTRGMNGHLKKDHDSPEHMAAIENDYAGLLHRYRLWATDYAHINWRIGGDIHKLVRMVKAHLDEHFDPMRDVENFMTKFGQFYNGGPRMLPEELHNFRVGFSYEEHTEYADAWMTEEGMKTFPEHIAPNLETQLDSLVDKVYVDLGTAQLHGFDFREAWRRVHEANMKKVRAQSAEESTRHSALDVVKPEGWEKPDHSDLVANHVHRQAVSQQ